MPIEGIKICVSVKLKYSVKFIKWSVTGKDESPIRQPRCQSSSIVPIRHLTTHKARAVIPRGGLRI